MNDAVYVSRLWQHLPVSELWLLSRFSDSQLVDLLHCTHGLGERFDAVLDALHPRTTTTADEKRVDSKCHELSYDETAFRSAVSFSQIHTIQNLPIFTRKLSSTRTSPTPAMFDPISCTGTCARALHVGGTSCRRNCLQGRAIFFILSLPHRAFGVSRCCRISD